MADGSSPSVILGVKVTILFDGICVVVAKKMPEDFLYNGESLIFVVSFNIMYKDWYYAYN